MPERTFPDLPGQDQRFSPSRLGSATLQNSRFSHFGHESDVVIFHFMEVEETTTKKPYGHSYLSRPARAHQGAIDVCHRDFSGLALLC